MFFLVQDPPVVHTCHWLIYIWVYYNLYMENQNPFVRLKNQPESSQDIRLLHQCQYLLLFQFSNHKLVRIYALPSGDATTDCDIVSNNDLLIALHKGKRTCTSHPNSLYILFTLASLLSYLYFFYRLIFCPQVCVRSPVYPTLEGCHEGKKLAQEQNGT